MNMLTRSCAEDYAMDNIFMNSVDTGWISKMLPYQLAKGTREPPLDEIDGASRVLDPVMKNLCN